MTEFPPGLEPPRTNRRPRRPRPLVTLLVTVGIALAVGIFVLGEQAVSHSRELGDHVDVTDELVDGNVRTIAQAQRELLRLQPMLLERGPGDEVDLQLAFITQRAHESALDYQLLTLGEQRLLATARDARRRWIEVVRPTVVKALTTPVGSKLRRGAAASVTRLENTYNDLASQGEIFRRAQAQEANRISGTAVTAADKQVRWFFAFVLAGAASIGLIVALLLRSHRQRAIAINRLERVNEHLQWYSRIVQATDSMLVATDDRGRVTWVNDAFVSETGWRREQVLGHRPGDFLQGELTDPDAAREVGEALGQRRRVRAELLNYRADGSTFWASIDISPVCAEDGSLDGFVAVQTDVTAQHEATQLLDQARDSAEKAAADKARFLSTMSHEIRTPLNAVLGLSDLLLLTELDEEQRDYAETAHRSGEHLLALVNDILDYSALESGRLTMDQDVFSTAELFDQVRSVFAAQTELAGLTLDVEVDPRVPPHLITDGTRLRQILVNLIGNAVKFTPTGGVEVRVGGRPSDDEGWRLEVTVTDTGIGIPEDVLPAMFRSFIRADSSLTRSRGGTGLGLAICRQLTDHLGGTIDVASEVGVGTRVHFDIPTHIAVEPTPQRVGPDAQLPDLSHLSVLLVEDDPINRKVATRMLDRLGVVPDISTNGREAVQRVLTGPPLDIVLMDVEMPEMDGLRASTVIRGAGDDTHQPWIIALTANVLPGDRERYLAAGMDGYVPKPISLNSLIEGLERLHSRGPERGAVAGLSTVV